MRFWKRRWYGGEGGEEGKEEGKGGQDKISTETPPLVRQEDIEMMDGSSSSDGLEMRVRLR